MAYQGLHGLPGGCMACQGLHGLPGGCMACQGLHGLPGGCMAYQAAAWLTTGAATGGRPPLWLGLSCGQASHTHFALHAIVHVRVSHIRTITQNTHGSV